MVVETCRVLMHAMPIVSSVKGPSMNSGGAGRSVLSRKPKDHYFFVSEPRGSDEQFQIRPNWSQGEFLLDDYCTSRQQRQSDIFSQPLAIGVGCSVIEPYPVFPAWRRSKMIDLASNAGLANCAAQCNAASMASLCSLHANDDRIDGTYQFIGYRAARRARHFAHIHRHPEVLATRTT
jgi:hypothetical protein